MIHRSDISWCDDGTSLAAAGGNGSVVFASLMGQAATWESLEVSLDPSLNALIVRDLIHETVEELDHLRQFFLKFTSPGTLCIIREICRLRGAGGRVFWWVRTTAGEGAGEGTAGLLRSRAMDLHKVFGKIFWYICRARGIGTGS